MSSDTELSAMGIRPTQGKAHLAAHGGYLLPYEHPCFACDAEYLAQLGRAPDDEDVAKVGADWVRPANKVAFQRLLDRITRLGVRA